MGGICYRLVGVWFFFGFSWEGNRFKFGEIEFGLGVWVRVFMSFSLFCYGEMNCKIMKIVLLVKLVYVDVKI